MAVSLQRFAVRFDKRFVNIAQYITCPDAVTRIDSRHRFNGLDPGRRVGRDLNGFLVILFEVFDHFIEVATQRRVFRKVLMDRGIDPAEFLFYLPLLGFAARREQNFTVTAGKTFLGRGHRA